MRAWVATAAAVAVAGVLAMTALAQTGRPFSVPIKDRTGDHERGLDVVRAALGRDDKGRLVAEVRMARGWGAAALRSDGDAQGSVCLRLYVKRDADGQSPDYLVCAMAPESGDSLVARVLRDRGNGLPRTVAKARVTRPSRRTVALRFTQKSIGRPARVRFAAEAVRHRKGCDAAVGCRDFAPEPPATIGIRLR